MTYPYTGVQFDEDGNPVDRDPAAIYRPRDVAAPKQPTPQAVSSTGDTPDNSTLYRPRYVEENPNNFGAQLAAATRPGSILNIIGTMTGGAQSAAAHKYNAAERMKFEDSVAQMRLALEQRRIQNEEARSNAPSRYTTWQDDVIQKWKNHELTDDQAEALLHGSRAPQQPKPPVQPKWLTDYSAGIPQNEGETDADYHARLFQKYQSDRAAHDTRIHPPRTTAPPRAPAAPRPKDRTAAALRYATDEITGKVDQNKIQEYYDNVGLAEANSPGGYKSENPSPQQFGIGRPFDRGRLETLPGRPGPPQRPQPIPNADPRTPIKMEPAGGKQYVRTGTDNATGKRVGMLPDGTIEVIN